MELKQDAVGAVGGVDTLVVRRVPWGHVLGTVGLFLVLAIFMTLFYRHGFTGLTDRESMDIAQVARNIAGGSGFTTRLVRPFNVGKLEIRPGGLPEVNHAPLFPYAMAGAFKAKGNSDHAAALVSMAFLFLSVIATYFLGRLLFDWRAGLLAASVFGISAPVLRAGTSATEWTMAALWFVLLLIAVTLHHKSVQRRPGIASLAYVAASALLLGLLYMTNHILVFLVIPLAIYYAFTGPSRRLHLVVFLVAAALSLSPWAYLTTTRTGGPVLGINAWDVFADTKAFPGDTFYRSADSANRGFTRVLWFPIERFSSFAEKLMMGSSRMLEAMVPLVGLAILGFAVVSMVYRFRAPSANAVRGLMYGAVPLMIACFALFSIGTRALVLFAPAAAVFGSAYFLLLLDAKKLHPVFARALVGGLVLVTCWPALSTIVWRGGRQDFRGSDIVHQYFTEIGQRGATGLVYTDVPWIVAWRTNGVGVWLPKSDDDVYELQGKGLAMHTVVLTPESLSYAQEEIWYLLYGNKWCRDFIRDSEEFEQRIMASSRFGEEQAAAVRRGVRSAIRTLSVSQSLVGFAEPAQSPFTPDAIRVLVSPGM